MLLNERTAAEYRYAVEQGAMRVAARLEEVDAPFSGATPDELESVISGIDLETPLVGVAAALDEVEEIYLRDAVYFHHPRYLAHLNCPVAIPALLGEALLAPINSSLDTWDQSAGATLIERRLIEWTARRIRLGDQADGVFTSGGTQSNLQALHIARDEACAHGADAAEMRVFVSEAGHFSVKKAAVILGLDEDAVVTIPCDPAMRMSPLILEHELTSCRAAGHVPMAVVATAGTTDFGSIDPLAQIAELCKRAGAWMHVDAAYGCGLLVSRTRRHMLAGLELADSVTVDFHKAFFQPISSSAVLVRDGSTLRHVTHHADYLNPKASENPNQVDKSLQTTRRFDALKLWLTLRMLGADGVGDMFDRVVDLAAEVYEIVEHDPRFEAAGKPALSALVFRYHGTDEANRYARAALLASGDAVVAGTTVRGRQYLKFTLLNPETTRDDVIDVLDLLAGHAAHFLSREEAVA